VADRIADEKVVGWLSGRMEFGPRALGSRSILGDARSRRMQSVMNLKIKFRESFRPFAPSVLAERAGEYFEMGDGCQSPYMLLVAPVRGDKRLGGDGQGQPWRSGPTEGPSLGGARHHARGLLARVQTVDAQRHGLYYRLMKAFERRTGCPVIINTSFNIRGEPIVCTPEHAMRCFMATNMDVLVLERFVLLKDEQPGAKSHDVEAYLAQFELD